MPQGLISLCELTVSTPAAAVVPIFAPKATPAALIARIGLAATAAGSDSEIEKQWGGTRITGLGIRDNKVR